MKATRYLVIEWRAMAIRQIYFCGSKAPIAALIDGKKLVTPQWVDVDASKWNNRDHTMQTISANTGNNTVTTANIRNDMVMLVSAELSLNAR